MKLIVNGDEQQQTDGITVSGLLQNLAKNPQLCAVEVNRNLVTRRLHDETILRDGDVVEIVTLVGGG